MRVCVLVRSGCVGFFRGMENKKVDVNGSKSSMVAGERVSERAKDHCAIFVFVMIVEMQFFLRFTENIQHRERKRSGFFFLSSFAGPTHVSFSLSIQPSLQMYWRFNVYIVFYFSCLAHCMCWSVGRPIGLNVASQRKEFLVDSAFVFPFVVCIYAHIFVCIYCSGGGVVVVVEQKRVVVVTVRSE